MCFIFTDCIEILGCAGGELESEKTILHLSLYSNIEKLFLIVNTSITFLNNSLNWVEYSTHTNIYTLSMLTGPRIFFYTFFNFEYIDNGAQVSSYSR